jgi:hypothetical protein
VGLVVAIKVSWRFGYPPPTLRVGGRGAATATDMLYVQRYNIQFNSRFHHIMAASKGRSCDLVARSNHARAWHLEKPSAARAPLIPLPFLPSIATLVLPLIRSFSLNTCVRWHVNDIDYSQQLGQSLQV